MGFEHSFNPLQQPCPGRFSHFLPVASSEELIVGVDYAGALVFHAITYCISNEQHKKKKSRNVYDITT